MHNLFANVAFDPFFDDCFFNLSCWWYHSLYDNFVIHKYSLSCTVCVASSEETTPTRTSGLSRNKMCVNAAASGKGGGRKKTTWKKAGWTGAIKLRGNSTYYPQYIWLSLVLYDYVTSRNPATSVSPSFSKSQSNGEQTLRDGLSSRECRMLDCKIYFAL